MRISLRKLTPALFGPWVLRVPYGLKPRGDLVLMLALGLICAGAAHAAGPPPAAHPLDAQGQMQIDDHDRCPVCAMLPMRSPRFAAAIQLDDGRTYYFCSAGCMLRVWLHPESFLRAGRERLHLPVARDYFSGKAIDARTAFWISGSDVIGPMGAALVPLADGAHVDVFRRRHGGREVFRLEDLNDASWKQLTGKP